MLLTSELLGDYLGYKIKKDGNLWGYIFTTPLDNAAIFKDGENYLEVSFSKESKTVVHKIKLSTCFIASMNVWPLVVFNYDNFAFELYTHLTSKIGQGYGNSDVFARCGNYNYKLFTGNRTITIDERTGECAVQTSTGKYHYFVYNHSGVLPSYRSLKNMIDQREGKIILLMFDAFTKCEITYAKIENANYDDLIKVFDKWQLDQSIKELPPGSRTKAALRSSE